MVVSREIWISLLHFYLYLYLTFTHILEAWMSSSSSSFNLTLNQLRHRVYPSAHEQPDLWATLRIQVCLELRKPRSQVLSCKVPLITTLLPCFSYPSSSSSSRLRLWSEECSCSVLSHSITLMNRLFISEVCSTTCLSVCTRYVCACVCWEIEWWDDTDVWAATLDECSDLKESMARKKDKL